MSCYMMAPGYTKSVVYCVTYMSEIHDAFSFVFLNFIFAVARSMIRGIIRYLYLKVLLKLLCLEFVLEVLSDLGLEGV